MGFFILHSDKLLCSSGLAGLFFIHAWHAGILYRAQIRVVVSSGLAGLFFIHAWHRVVSFFDYLCRAVLKVGLIHRYGFLVGGLRTPLLCLFCAG